MPRTHSSTACLFIRITPGSGILLWLMNLRWHIIINLLNNISKSDGGRELWATLSRMIREGLWRNDIRAQTWKKRVNHAQIEGKSSPDRENSKWQCQGRCKLPCLNNTEASVAWVAQARERCWRWQWCSTVRTLDPFSVWWGGESACVS